jgi:hypothetical protein
VADGSGARSPQQSARPYAASSSPELTEALAKSEEDNEAFRGSAATRRSRLAANALPEAKLPAAVTLHEYIMYGCAAAAENSGGRRTTGRSGSKAASMVLLSSRLRIVKESRVQEVTESRLARAW